MTRTKGTEIAGLYITSPVRIRDCAERIDSAIREAVKEAERTIDHLAESTSALLHRAEQAEGDRDALRERVGWLESLLRTVRGTIPETNSWGKPNRIRKMIDDALRPAQEPHCTKHGTSDPKHSCDSWPAQEPEERHKHTLGCCLEGGEDV